MAPYFSDWSPCVPTQLTQQRRERCVKGKFARLGLSDLGLSPLLPENKIAGAATGELQVDTSLQEVDTPL